MYKILQPGCSKEGISEGNTFLGPSLGGALAYLAVI